MRMGNGVAVFLARGLQILGDGIFAEHFSGNGRGFLEQVLCTTLYKCGLLFPDLLLPVLKNANEGPGMAVSVILALQEAGMGGTAVLIGPGKSTSRKKKLGALYLDVIFVASSPHSLREGPGKPWPCILTKITKS